MSSWSLKSLNEVVYNFEKFNENQKRAIHSVMNDSYPPEVYGQHCNLRTHALENSHKTRTLLSNATQHFPPYILPENLSPNQSSLKTFGLVFTAGGEGERLRLSLLERGVPGDQLENFTKATFPLPNFYKNFGTLHINLAMISHFCRSTGIDIPVIVTTGPKNSITASIIPLHLKAHDNFGLKNIRIISQEERLHLTHDEKVVFIFSGNTAIPVTQPDETGGPLMQLKKQTSEYSTSALQWFESLGCTKTILVQATSIYKRQLLPLMAEALGNYECCGVGIMRSSFPTSDPFGTYISLEQQGKKKISILEQDIRNNDTYRIKNENGRYHLPFNTGFYAFNNQLLLQNNLPDFATPPKEILPELDRSPKIGYAATDLISSAHNSIVLAINSSMFGVLKTADDLAILSELGKNFGLDQICKTIATH